jgi:atypical dual specificity phosphatase
MSLITLPKTRISRLIDQSWRMLFGTPTEKRSRIWPHLYLGGQLYQRGTKTLRRWGVTGVISLRQSLPKQFIKSGFKLLHIPVKEHDSPSLEQLIQGVKFIEQEIDLGGTIYVHCLHGEGRGPTMVAAYLISQGFTVERALSHISSIRPFISPSKSQVDRLHMYEQSRLGSESGAGNFLNSFA